MARLISALNSSVKGSSWSCTLPWSTWNRAMTTTLRTEPCRAPTTVRDQRPYSHQHTPDVGRPADAGCGSVAAWLTSWSWTTATRRTGPAQPRCFNIRLVLRRQATARSQGPADSDTLDG